MPKRAAERLERRHIETLVMVAKCGSIHAAARALELPQPQVTNLLRDAERIAGRRLFERSHTGCVVLPDAREWIGGAIYAEKALETLDRMDDTRQMRLRLGCIPRVSHTFVPVLLRELEGTANLFRLEILEGTANQLQSLLVEGELDCFIGRLPSAMDDARDSFAVESLYEERTVLIAGVQHPLAGRRRLGLRELTAYPWILPRTQSYSREMLNEVFARDGVAAPAAMIASLSFLSNLHLVSQSLCISIAPDRAAWEFERQGSIRILRTQANFGAYAIVMVHHHTIMDHPGFRDFVVAARHAAGRIRNERRAAT
jgi:DNA-binding transcriptional LysR family regulator